MARDVEIKGMKELERLIQLMGKVPQSVATKSAKAGATIALKAARRSAPEDKGDLKGGIILKPERRVVVGKKVYDVMMDPTKNDVFVKTSKEGKRSYYPASQEYGFMTANGGFVPGFHFLRNSITENSRAIEEKIVQVAGLTIDKVMK
ncbi:HK97 gp10 family phage protein [Paenibacillus vini]|uniref:HK97 gp10 family phage protein n=1 Tax=Paenibacillus vini TaxID=1476024 RepID=UPI0025B6549C|nr:HK97 gp10 family phage protein [Paenibacillus vini]MDN4069938.1 HK97 gp10 family phage protein [Paenibacillus vini]